MKKIFWFVGPFMCTLIICIGAWWVIFSQIVIPSENVAAPSSSLLLNMQFPTSDITDARSGEPVSLPADTLSNAVVILLGGIGCSRNQVEVLRWWKENERVLHTTGQSILTLYADPLMGVDRSRHESLLLRRASEVNYPALVYGGGKFNPRSMGIQTPQTVHVQDGRIVEVIPYKHSMGIQ